MCLVTASLARITPLVRSHTPASCTDSAYNVNKLENAQFHLFEKGFQNFNFRSISLYHVHSISKNIGTLSLFFLASLCAPYPFTLFDVSLPIHFPHLAALSLSYPEWDMVLSNSNGYKGILNSLSLLSTHTVHHSLFASCQGKPIRYRQIESKLKAWRQNIYYTYTI